MEPDEKLEGKCIEQSMVHVAHLVVRVQLPNAMHHGSADVW